MSKRVVSGNVCVFVTGNDVGPNELASLEDSKLIERLTFSREHMKGYEGWVYVGDATVTIEIIDTQEIVAGQVQSLEAQKQKVMADSQLAITRIDRQIQQLLAIEMSPEAS